MPQHQMWKSIDARRGDEWTAADRRQTRRVGAGSSGDRRAKLFNSTAAGRLERLVGTTRLADTRCESQSRSLRKLASSRCSRYAPRCGDPCPVTSRKSSDYDSAIAWLDDDAFVSLVAHVVRPILHQNVR